MISMKGLSKAYTLGDEKLVVVNHIDLTIKSGEFVSIIGKSGSGKTTLMNVVGLLDDFDEGEYTFDGEVVADLSARRLARIRNKKIGFVYQNFNLLSKQSAVENVMLPMLFSGMSRRKAKERAIQYLKLVELGDKLHNKPTQLSGGQQQRVAIARALVNEPKLLLLDEPTGALDTHTGEDILNLIKDIWQKQKITVIVVTHDYDIANAASRILHMKDGKFIDIEEAKA